MMMMRVRIVANFHMWNSRRTQCHAINLLNVSSLLAIRDRNRFATNDGNDFSRRSGFLGFVVAAAATTAATCHRLFSAYINTN